jgi:hypothetical protein
MPGAKYECMPVPILRDKTTIFDAGSVRVAIERRDLDDNILDNAYRDDPEGRAIVARFQEQHKNTAPTAEELDGFVSVHVLGADDLEYVRFDCVNSDPHFHYINPHEKWNIHFHYDPVADGEFVEWVFDRIRTRLPEMMTTAEAPEEFRNVDQAKLEEALKEAIPLVRSTIAAQQLVPIN